MITLTMKTYNILGVLGKRQTDAFCAFVPLHGVWNANGKCLHIVLNTSYITILHYQVLCSSTSTTPWGSKVVSIPTVRLDPVELEGALGAASWSTPSTWMDLGVLNRVEGMVCLCYTGCPMKHWTHFLGYVSFSNKNVFFKFYKSLKVSIISSWVS